MKNQPEFKGVVYGGVSNLLMNLLTNDMPYLVMVFSLH